MEENHPWMRFFTWVTIIAGGTAVYYTLSESWSLLWFVLGVVSVIVGISAIIGTNDYKRLSESSGSIKLMAILSSTTGALLSSLLITFIFMAYAAFKQNQRDRLT
jgi:calcineurin-like phosphoesterase